jgi:hypothetical protein
VKLSQPLNLCNECPIDLPVSAPWQIVERPPVQIFACTEPPSVQPMPASLPADIQALLAKFSTILHLGYVVPNTTHVS